MKVTISDVARLAGVSTATVSHTINNTRYVSSETKEKVYSAIAELGYTPDASARSFRTGKKKTIGFIVPDISNKFFATMIESVENYLSAHGYHLIIANTKENPEREETNIRLLTAGLVDGLLIASTMEDFQRFDDLIPAGFPVVLVNRTFETKKYSSICVSNFQPIYRSVCRLAGKGDTRIGIIGGLPRLSSTRERISAYQQAVVNCGLPQDEALIRYGDSMENSARACLDELLMRLSEIFLSVPNLLLVILLQAAFGKAGILSLSVVIGVTSWAGMARVVRTEVRQLRGSEYVIASRAMGGRFAHILGQHLAPNFFSSIMFMVVMNVRSAIVAESTLSFLGMGLPIDTVSWGSMLSLSERALMTGSWWVILIPGAFLVALLLSLTEIGNWLRREGSRRESNL